MFKLSQKVRESMQVDFLKRQRMMNIGTWSGIVLGSVSVKD